MHYVLIRKRFLVIAFSGLFCLLAGGRYVWLTLGPGSWGPRFACAESCFDCGEVSADQGVEHEFVISNTGRQPFLILKAMPGCGACLTVNVSKNEVTPGDTSILKIVLDVSKLGKGPFVKKLLVMTDDPNLPRVILFVRGTVL